MSAMLYDAADSDSVSSSTGDLPFEIHDGENGQYAEIDARALLGNGNQRAIESAIFTCAYIDCDLPEEYKDSVTTLDKLVACLLELDFERPGSTIALAKAINLSGNLYDELGGTAAINSLRSYRANNYAVALSRRYWRDRNPEDLYKSLELGEEAVRASAQATSITTQPEGTILKGAGLEVHTVNTLAARLDEVFQLEGSLENLDRSIDMMKRLVAAVPQEEFCDSMAEWLGNLSASLLRRYEQNDRTGGDDLDCAIDAARRGLNLVDNVSGPVKASALCALAHPLARRAADAQDTNADDLNEAITLLQKACNNVPKDHPQQIELGLNLAMRLFQRSEANQTAGSLMTDLDHEIETATSTGSTTDLDQGIETATSALELAKTLDDRPNQAHLQNFLGLFYIEKCARGSERDAQTARDYLWAALHSPDYTPVIRRVQAGRVLMRLCSGTNDWKGAYEASAAAGSLVPRLTPRSIRNSDKQRVLSNTEIVRFGTDAAAVALNADQGSSEALRLLEIGRGLLAASVSELRADLVALRRENPLLANEFVRLRDGLQIVSPRQRQASDDFDTLLARIRGLPGFKGFLAPPTTDELLEAAQGGPVAVLNVSIHRVDAILVKSDGLRVLPLTGVKLEDLEERSTDLESPKLLEWLWTVIAEPVLDALGFKEPPKDGQLPRMWWVATGILAGFPLHAAGHHSVGSSDSVIDRVVSSYSPTVKELLNAYRRNPPPPPLSTFKALLVAVVKTPNLPPDLPFTAMEAQAAKSALEKEGVGCTLLDDGARKQDVLQSLKQCQIFHFAGHGKENFGDPSRSALLLCDWETDPLTVGCLLDVNLSDSHPFLAYLSACETGQVTMAKFHDESVHLMSAYQLAGFRHVIGTMWSVGDAASVEIAKATYTEMLKRGLTDESVCRSLHLAVKKQRDEAIKAWSVRRESGGNTLAVRKIGLEDSSEDESGDSDDGSADEQNSVECDKSWIPFIHFGV